MLYAVDTVRREALEDIEGRSWLQEPELKRRPTPSHDHVGRRASQLDEMTLIRRGTIMRLALGEERCDLQVFVPFGHDRPHLTPDETYE